MMRLSSLLKWEYHGTDQIEYWFQKYTTFIAWGCLVTGPIAISMIPDLAIEKKIVTIGLISVFVVFCFVTLNMAKKGYYTEASWGLMSTLFVVVSFVTLMLGGVQSKGMDVYYTLAMATGFFLNKKGQRLFLFLSIAAIFAMWFAENNGFPSSLGDSSDPAYFIVPAVLLTIVSFLSRSIFEHLAGRKKEMEELVIERTAQLKTAKEEAEWRSEQMSNFLTNMSHEIRTPLMAIIGSADILDEMEGEERTDTVRIIKKGGSRLMDTLNSVLELTSLDRSSRNLDLEVMNVTSIVEETVEFFRPGAEEKGLIMKLVSKQEVFANVNLAAFTRVLQNIVGNAIKFTDKGAIYIEVHKQGPKGVIKIADTGIGISQEFLPHVFDKFRQESEGVGRLHEGNGIGLSISQRLMKLMSGNIRVESEVDEGSVFTIFFPVVKEKKNRRRNSNKETESSSDSVRMRRVI